jgi:hypothetical protein
MGYGLWVNLIQRAEPHRVERFVLLLIRRAVAAQVAFERQTLKPVFSPLIGARVETSRLSAMDICGSGGV